MGEPSSIEVEYILAYQYQAAVVLEKSKEEQYKDIDLRDTQGRGYSVKLQKRAAETGNFSFETALIDTRTGERVDGNFAQCKAFGYFLVVPEGEGVYRTYWFRAEDLHAFVFGNISQWRKVRLTEKVRATNSGRKYDDAESVLVPMYKVTPLAVHSDTFDYAKLRADLKYHLFLKENDFVPSSSPHRPSRSFQPSQVGFSCRIRDARREHRRDGD